MNKNTYKYNKHKKISKKMTETFKIFSIHSNNKFKQKK